MAKLLLLFPVLVWGWGNDVIIDTLRSNRGEYPASFDITWRDTTDILVGIGLNKLDTAYAYFYNSNDRGNTWNRVAIAQWTQANISKIQLIESPLYLITMWQEKGNRVGFTIHNRNNLNSYTAAIISESDSIVDAISFFIESWGKSNLYIGVVTRNMASNTDALKIYKSENYGAFQQKIVRYFSNNNYFLFLKDMDAVLKQDTVILYLTLESLDRSNNKSSLSYRILREDPSGSITETSLGYPTQFASPLNSSSGNSDAYTLTVFQADNDLKYIFGYDYSNTIGLYTFPYNTQDSVEWGPFVKGWTSGDTSGFHIIFARGNITYGSKLYYIKATANGSSIQFSPPVLISDEIPICKTPYNFQSNYYNPKIATLKEEYAPVIIWPQDFWHLFYGAPYYDSTYFVIDKIEVVKVKESLTNTSELFKVYTQNSFITLIFKDITGKEYKGEVFNVEGELIKSFKVPSGTQRFNLDLTNLRKGAYFVALKDKNSIVKVKKFLIW